MADKRVSFKLGNHTYDSLPDMERRPGVLMKWENPKAVRNHYPKSVLSSFKDNQQDDGTDQSIVSFNLSKKYHL